MHASCPVRPETPMFHSSGKLLLFRMEALDGKALPSSAAERQKRPRVCQIRDLLADDPIKPLATISDFNWHVFRVATSPDGRYFAVNGSGGPGGKKRWIKAFDGPTGAELWSIDSTSTRDGGPLAFDPTGDILYISALDAVSRACG